MSIQAYIDNRTRFLNTGSVDRKDPGTYQSIKTDGEPSNSLVIRDLDDYDVTIPVNVHVRFFNCTMANLHCLGGNSVEIAGSKITDTLTMEYGGQLIVQNDTSSQLITKEEPKTPNGRCEINSLVLKKTRMRAQGSELIPVVIGNLGGDMNISDESSLEWFYVDYLAKDESWTFNDSIGRFQNCKFNNGGSGNRAKMFFQDCEVYAARIGVYCKDRSFVQATRCSFRGPQGSGNGSPLDYEGLHIWDHSSFQITNCDKNTNPEYWVSKVSARNHSSGEAHNVDFIQLVNWAVWADEYSHINISGDGTQVITSPCGLDHIYNQNTIISISDKSKVTIRNYKHIQGMTGTTPAVRMTDNSYFQVDGCEQIMSEFGDGIVNAGGGRIILDEITKGVIGGGFGITFVNAEVELTNMMYVTGGLFAGICGVGGKLTIINVDKINSLASEGMKLSGTVLVVEGVSDIIEGITGGISASNMIIDLNDITCVQATGPLETAIDINNCTLRLTNTKVIGLLGDGIHAEDCAAIYLNGCTIEGGGTGLWMKNCTATLRSNTKIKGYAFDGVYAENCSVDSHDDQLIEGGGDNGVSLLGTKSRFILPVLIIGETSGILSLDNKGLELDGGPNKVTTVRGNTRSGIELVGRTMIVKNALLIESIDSDGIQVSSTRDSVIEGCTEIAGAENGINSISNDSLFIYRNDLIEGRVALHGIQVSDSDGMKLDENVLIKGFVDGINSTGSDFVCKHLSDKVMGTMNAGISMVGSEAHLFETAKLHGGLYGVHITDSVFYHEIGEEIKGFGADGVYATGSEVKAKFINSIFGAVNGVVLTGGSPGYLQMIRTVTGAGSDGIQVSSGSIHANDVETINGLGLNGINMTNSSGIIRNVGTITGVVSGVSAIGGTTEIANVGTITGAVNGMDILNVSTSVLDRVNNLIGGAVGLNSVGSAHIALHDVTRIVGPIATSLIESTVEECDEVKLDGALALNMLSNSAFYSERTDYLGLITSNDSEWSAKHGKAIGVVTLVDSKVSTSDFEFVAAFNSTNSDCSHDDTKWLGVVNALADTTMLLAGSTILGNLLVVDANCEITKSSVVGVTTVYASNMKSVKSVLAITIVDSSSFDSHSSTIGEILGSSSSITIHNVNIGAIVATGGSSLNGMSSTTAAILLDGSANLVNCTAAGVVVTNGGIVTTGGTCGIIVCADASAICLSTNAVVLGGPVPVTCSNGRSIHVSTDVFENSTLKSQKSFSGQSIQGLAIIGSVQWYAGNSVRLDALGNVHSKPLGGFATHDVGIGIPPTPV